MNRLFLTVSMISVIGILFVAQAATNNAQVKTQVTATDTSAKKVPEPAVEKTILFFMNPNGYPCQTQDGIIKNMAVVKQGKVHVQYRKTTVDGDMDAFYKYGIRALPSLIILGKDSSIVHRFTPGIQSEDAINSILAQ
jgi:hypothetical protein